MTGYDIYESAMFKLGYNSSRGSIENDVPFKAVAIEAINEIGESLCKLSPIKRLEDIVNIDEKTKSPLTYGVAMMLSFYSGDTEKNRIMTEIFNAKRTSYLSGKSKVLDTSPIIYGV